MRQAENRVRIEGILSEINIETRTFNRNDEPVEALSGRFIVKTTETISGEERTLFIPVHVFSTKYKKDGTTNPSYESISRLMTDFKSIAAVGNEDEADRVRITNGRISENAYFSRDGRLISYPRIEASFISKIRPEECVPGASFVVEFYVCGKEEELDREGEPTGRLKVKGAIPQYGGKVSMVDFLCESKKVIDGVSSLWELRDTVRAKGLLNFTSSTETVLEEMGFGDPIEKVRTYNRSELIIGGGSDPIDNGYTRDEITEAIAERKARLEAQKDRNMARAKERTAPKPTSILDDLGF